MTINLYHGDSLEVLPTIANDTFDIVFTSPPYNRKRNDKYEHYDDQIDDYFTFLKTVIDHCIRVSRGNVFFNLQKNYYNKHDVFKLIGHYAESLTEIFIWEKSNPMPASGFNITNAYEFIMVFGDKLKSNNTYTKNHITTSVAKMDKKHKAVMNIKVSDYFIKNFSQKGDYVLDPFMGLATTAHSCIKMGRSFAGIEKEEIYFQMSEENIKKWKKEIWIGREKKDDRNTI